MIEDSRPLYHAVQDEDNLELVSIEIHENADKTYWIKRTPISLIETYNRFQYLEIDSNPKEYDFYLSHLVLLESERSQRRTVLRISDHSTRNIKCYTNTTEQYLIESIKKAIVAKQYPYSEFPNMTKQDRNQKKRKIQGQDFKEMLDEAFIDLKKKLGITEQKDFEFSYTLSDDVLAHAESSDTLQYLEQKQAQQSQSYLSIKQFENICSDLEQRYPEEAERIIAHFKETKSRDHIAAISLTTEYGQTFISIASAENQYVKMEGWKFIRLIEDHDTTLRLHEFQKRRGNQPADPFEFNMNTEGIVVGQFNLTESCIHINCADKDKPQTQVHDNSTFNVDTSYILCLYTILKRLREDKERFDRLEEKAKTTPSLYDPFNA